MNKEEVLMQLRTDFNFWDFSGGTMELGKYSKKEGYIILYKKIKKCYNTIDI